MPKIGNKVINYSIYGKISDRMKLVADTTNCQLPSIENSTDTIKGAGIMGEIDLPSFLGLGSMTFSFGTRIDGEDGASLSAPKLQEIEVRWVTDKFDSANAVVGIDAHKAIIKGLPKKYEPGKIEAGNAMDGNNEFEVLYYKKVLNGKTIMEIDKLNYKFMINGIDYAGQVASAL